MAKDMLLFATQSDVPVSNFHARLVGPDIGVHEDPPIASAMPAFTGYLCAHENLAKGRHAFVIDRGMKTTRKSVLSIEMDNNETKENTIRVGGPAVMIGEGLITLPDK
jgi:trans-2,3-dihydro-3-hydroxyanthranilate isomerase